MFALARRAVVVCVFVFAGGCRHASEPAPDARPVEPTASAASAPSPAPLSATTDAAGSSVPDAGPVSSSASPDTARCDALFGPLFGAKPLCSEHVLGEGAEIAWQSYAFKGTPRGVFDSYRKVAEECGASAVTKPPQLSYAKGDRRLSVHAAKDNYPTCATKAGPGDDVVVIVSQKMNRP